ncbi:MAG TPA: hypothetical protein VFV85_05250 [Conexibacter sp.]|nr:hypothetical protein [Conexibacter sp.]
MRFLIVRIDAEAEHRDTLRAWIAGEHLPSVAGVPGFAPGAAAYEAVETPTAVRRYPGRPHFTIAYPLDDGIAVEAIFGADVFQQWWLDAMRARFHWFTTHRWVVCEQKLGPETPFTHRRMIFSEVDVAPGHEDAWGPWYLKHHVPDAAAVPGMFEPELRRFESLDVATPRFHCAARPRFVQLLPIRDDADILARSAAPEFLTQAADTQATWGGALTFLSTVCTRIEPTTTGGPSA